MMNKPANTEIIHQTARFTVTMTDVRSRNDMYTLDAVSHCRLRRPLFGMTFVAVICLSALVSVWWDDLLDGERLVFAVACTAALLVSSQLARLQLMSLQLNQTYLYGPTGEMRSLKSGIEQALMARSRAHVQPVTHPQQ